MKLGLISDTHDHFLNIGRAMDLFSRSGVDRVVHAGDYGSAAAVCAMQGIPVLGVLGNNDANALAFARAFAQIGGVLAGSVGEFSFRGGRGVVYHGFSPAVRDDLLYNGKYELVVLGHTHAVRDHRAGKTRVINPGTAHGFGGSATVMIFDDSDDTVSLFHL